MKAGEIMPDKETILVNGWRLQELRKKKKLTQKEVADILNVHENTIGGYENNTRTPSLENVIALAVLYNSSVDFILGMDKRTNLYLDDFTDEQKEFITYTVEKYRKFFKNRKSET